MRKRLSFIIFLTAFMLLSGLVVSRVTNAQPPFLQTIWTAEFYATTDFTGNIVASSTYTTLSNINWQGAPTNSAGQPIPNVPADNYSVRFRKGPFTVTPGDYNYSLVSNGPTVLRANNADVITFGNTGGNRTFQLRLPASVSFELRFANITGPALLQFTEPNTGGGGGGQPPFVTAGPTPTPTATGTPTQTALPPIPPGAITATVIRAAVLNVRDAPTLGGNRLGQILRGQTYAIVGRDEDARWFLLQLSGYQAWAYGYYLFVDGNEFTPPIVSGNTVLGLAGQQDYGVRGQTSATLRLREAPNVASRQTGRITWGGFLPIVGRTADGFWYQVVWKDTVGWAYSPFIDIVEGDINAVPVR